MKYLLILLLFVCSFAYAQEPAYVPMKSNYAYKGIRMDSLFILPNLDTSAARKVNGNLIRQSDKFYWYDTTAWKAFGANGTSIDTTSLSNRINDKIDSLRRVGTQVSFKKNGTWYNAYIDSTGESSQNLQQVTDIGNTTTNDIQFTNDNDLLMDTFSSVLFSNNSRVQEGYIDAGYGGNKGVALVCGLGYEYKWEGGRLFVMNNSGNQIREAKYMFSDIPDSSRDYTEGYYVGSRWVLDNGNTYLCTDNSLNAAVWSLLPNAFDSTSLSNRINNKVDSITKHNDSVKYWKNGTAYFAFKDSVGSVNGFVPYTGATQDVDLGNNGLNAKNIKVTGTAGSGHIDLKHQSGDATGQANSTKLYANSIGYLKWKNDNLYYSTLAMPQTADRVYTYQNKSYTLGDSADIALKLNISDSSIYQPKYRSDTMSTNIYATLNGKQATLNGTGFVKASGTTISYENSTYLTGSDTTSLSNRINTKLNTSDSTLYQTKYRTDTMRTNIYNQLAQELNVADTANMLRNYQRTSAFPIATFGAGSGAAGDTSAFSTSALYGSFYLNAGADTIIVTGYTGIVQGTSASVTPTIWFNDSLNVTAGATKIVNSPSAVTSTTTGNTVTSLDNTKIPPGNFVWVTTGTVTTKPTYFNLTLIGYRKR